MKKYTSQEYAELAHRANSEGKMLVTQSDGTITLEDKTVSLEEAKEQAYLALETRLDREIAQGKKVTILAASIRVFGEQPSADKPLLFTFGPEDKASFTERILEFQNGTRGQPVDWNYDSEGTHVFFNEALLTEVYKELAKREDLCRENYASHQVALAACASLQEVDDFMAYTLPQGWPAS